MANPRRGAVERGARARPVAAKANAGEDDDDDEERDETVDHAPRDRVKRLIVTGGGCSAPVVVL